MKMKAKLAVNTLAIFWALSIPVSKEVLAVQTPKDIMGNIEGNIVPQEEVQSNAFPVGTLFIARRHCVSHLFLG